MRGAAVENDLGRGFRDPVLGAQRCFRALLMAMSEPGTVRRLQEPVDAPRGLAPASAQLLLTMADFETTVWLTPDIDATATRWVRFHTGAPMARESSGAGFAVLDGGADLPLLSAFDPGEDRYPDRSATLLIQCEALEGGRPVQLSGPGIRDRITIAPRGLRRSFWQEFAANGERYPLGVDMVLVAGNGIIGLPRTVRVSGIEEAG